MRKKATWALGGAVVLLSGMLSANSASADTVLVTCTGTNVITYEPGITYTEKTVHITGEDNAALCVDAAKPLELLSFEAPFSGEFTTSCASVFSGGTGTQTLKWKRAGELTGETSEWHWTMHFSTNANGQLLSIADGPIVSGRYAGKQLRQVITVATGDQTACSQPGGLTETSGPSSWVFTF